MSGFLAQLVVAGLRWYRMWSQRHAVEQAHLKSWPSTALGYRDANYDLSVEILKCRRLIVGYSDTHARDPGKFDRVLAGIAIIANRFDAVDWARRLGEVALKNESGAALDGALATNKLFAKEAI